MRQPFGAALAGAMFQCKIDDIFKELPNVLGIANDTLIVGYNAGDEIMFFSEIISRCSV